MKYTIFLKSSTAALKAKSVLDKAGIKSQYAKLTDKSGCKFAIKTDTDADKVCRILALSLVECLSVKKENGAG